MEGSGPPSGGRAFGERWLSYLERKTELEDLATVAWACTLAPLPLLGARIQTVTGSALTVFFVGSETRPRGQTERISFSGERSAGAFS